MGRILRQALVCGAVAVCFSGAMLFAATTISMTDPASPMMWSGGSATSCTATWTFVPQGQVKSITAMRVRMICSESIQTYSNVTNNPPNPIFTHNFNCPQAHVHGPPGEQMNLWIEAVNNLGGIDGSASQWVTVVSP
jgi:hypothetical protein